MATGAEKVLKWMNEFYAQNGTPNFGEIVAQLEMAIAEEKFEGSNKDEEIRAEMPKMPQSDETEIDITMHDALTYLKPILKQAMFYAKSFQASNRISGLESAVKTQINSHYGSLPAKHNKENIVETLRFVVSALQDEQIENEFEYQIKMIKVYLEKIDKQQNHETKRQ
jgi:hypothetical protein